VSDRRDVQPLVEHVGNERTAMLTLDGFDMFTAPLQNAAARATYSPDTKTFYPGLRAPLPGEMALAILQGVYRQLYRIFEIPAHLRLKPREATFSVITSAPESLGNLQKIPHFDTSNPYFFALLLYLNPGPHGGTGFFRHRDTGFERIGDERSEHYFASADRLLQQQGGPSSGYVTQSRDGYELFHRVDYRQHRLVVYPGNLLHSILVDPHVDIEADPARGRLTANLFFEFC